MEPVSLSQLFAYILFIYLFIVHCALLCTVNKSSSPLMCDIWNFRLSASDCITLCGKLEEILTFQQGLCVALEECTK